MKTKIVYVLTSNTNDYYLEQAILSMYSLLLHNPDAKISLVVDKDTADSFVDNRAQIHKYISELIIVNIPNRYKGIQKSRYLKTTLREQIEGNYLYIDTDTIITANISEIDSFSFDIGAVIDKHLPIQDHTSEKAIRKLAKKFDWKIPEDGNYYNSGVMYVRDSAIAHKLYEKWHETWLNGIEKFNINIDQPSLAKANEMVGSPIYELSGIYNCQLIENGLRFLIDAKILHYFAANIGSTWDCPYLFRDMNLYNKVATYGINEEIHEMIIKAKSAFLPKCTIIAGNQTDVYGKPLAGIARRLSLRYPSLNSFLEKILSKS